jgi:hypothetical protein
LGRAPLAVSIMGTFKMARYGWVPISWQLNESQDCKLCNFVNPTLLLSILGDGHQQDPTKQRVATSWVWPIAIIWCNSATSLGTFKTISYTSWCSMCQFACFWKSSWP